MLWEESGAGNSCIAWCGMVLEEWPVLFGGIYREEVRNSAFLLFIMNDKCQ